jgi:hypothetical protein
MAEFLNLPLKGRDRLFEIQEMSHVCVFFFCQERNTGPGSILVLLPRSGKRVRFGDKARQPIWPCSGIDLCCRDISVPQQGLQPAQVGTAIQHVGGK